MADEMLIDGVEYVSSKRAAETTGYAQDYIGQLARSGSIDARRVGGLWFVNLKSIDDHQSDHTEDMAAQDITNPRHQSSDPESFVGLDGKSYISAHRAAKLSGYNQDYVGQLARSGQIVSRQVGNRWYVDQDSLQAHKDQKEALLAAVQSDSVGLAKPSQGEKVLGLDEDAGLMSYFRDEGTLLPDIHVSRDAENQHFNDGEENPGCDHSDSGDESKADDGVATVIAIRKSHIPAVESVSRTEILPHGARQGIRRLPAVRSSRLPMVLGGTAAALTVVLVVATGSSLMRSSAVYASDNTSQMGALSLATERLIASIEALFTHELVYIRNR